MTTSNRQNLLQRAIEWNNEGVRMLLSKSTAGMGDETLRRALQSLKAAVACPDQCSCVFQPSIPTRQREDVVSFSDSALSGLATEERYIFDRPVFLSCPSTAKNETLCQLCAAAIVFNEAIFYHQQTFGDTASKLYEMVIAILSSAAFPHNCTILAVAALNNLGTIHFDRGSFDAASDCMQQAANLVLMVGCHDEEENHFSSSSSMVHPCPAKAFERWVLDEVHLNAMTLHKPNGARAA